MRRIPAFLLSAYLAVLLATSTVAAAEDLRLTGPIGDSEVFSGHVTALRDPEGRLQPQDLTGTDAGFMALETPTADFGYTRDVIWLRLALRNETVDAHEWLLHVQENFMREFAVWSLDEAGILHLLESHTPETRFHDRKVAYPQIAIPLVLEPGARSVLLVRYASGGETELSFAIETEDSFDRLASRKTAKHFVYYGMMLILIIAASIAFLTGGKPIFAAYAAYATSGLLYLMHADGTAFQYLWPRFPGVNGQASVGLGAALIVTGSQFARMFVQTARYHPLMDRILIANILVAFALVGLAFYDSQASKKLLVLMAMISCLLFLVAGVIAAFSRFREVRFYLLAWFGALLASGLMTARHWLGIEVSEEFQFDAIRIVLVADAGLMGFAIIDRVNQLRRLRQTALETALQEAQRNLDLGQRLATLEQRHALAVELARSQQRALADTAHDLRQPLQALRLNVQALLRGGSKTGAKPTDFEATFDYLEELVSRELDRHGALASVSTPERHRVDEVLSAVHTMFAASAQKTGGKMRYVRTGRMTSLPPLDLMRIASNLVSNAVKYAPGGKVLLGVRRHRKGWRLEVHDTGPGLAPDEFQLAQERAVRLPAGAALSEGNGFGLSIVMEIAQRHGLLVQLCPRRRTGTSILVHVPD